MPTTATSKSGWTSSAEHALRFPTSEAACCRWILTTSLHFSDGRDLMPDDEQFYSSKRARTYKRGFDHDLARAKNLAGQSIRSIAIEFGVATSAVWQVV